VKASALVTVPPEPQPALPTEDPARARARGRAQRLSSALVADITPLRESADYRRLWLGLTVNQLGQQMTAVAVAIQVFALTESTFAVGLVGIFALVPLIAFGLYGGAVADVLDRRLVVLASSTGLWLLSVVLLAQALLSVDSVPLLYSVVALQSACFAVNNPARAAIIPRLLPPEQMPAANALSTLSFSLGFTTGPLLGGLVIGAFGLGAAYGIDALTFAAALYAVLRLPAIPPEPAADGSLQRAGLRSVLEGLRFLRTRPNVLMTFLVDLCAMVLAQPRALFPKVSGTFYGGGTATVGLLVAAPAIGALVAALSSGWLGRVRRQGLAILVCVAIYGLAVAAFGFTSSLWLGVLFLAVSGAADMVSAAYRTTILQVATPDVLRGRLQGVFIVVVAGGPRLGDFVAGSVAELTTSTFAIAAGGSACVVGVGLLAARFRGFARYDARHPMP
jgi:MFS family permease